MTDEELKRLLEATSSETRRHFDVAMEHVEKRFDALAEIVAHLDQKIDRQGNDTRDELRRRIR